VTGLALALAVLAAAPPEVPGGRNVPVEIAESGSVSFEPGTGRWLLEGGAVLKRGDVTLRADTARYDPRTGEIDAAGGVLLVQPGRALSAQRLHAVVDGPFEAHDVIAFTKEGPLDLSRCRTVDEARTTGFNRVTFRGARVAGKSGDPHLDVSSARVTLCDCGGGPPSWEIRASSADVVPGKRAWLTWPVFWVTPRFLFIERPVPVLALPAIYLPLAERQTGLLLPEIGFGRTGFAFSLPLFLAFSESYDATVAYDQAFGPAVGHLASPTDFAHRRVRGPGSSLELRWAPSEETRGQMRLFWIHDQSQDEVPLPGGGFARSPAHGDRFALTLRHDQRIGADGALRADVGLVGDPLYASDFTADLLLRAAEYRRSSLWAAQRTDDALLAAEVGYHQPLLYLGQQSFAVDPTTNVPRVPYGTFGTDVPVFHRLPALTATLLPLRLAGPLALSGSATVARFAPFDGRLGDEGVDGLGPGGRGWTVADAGEHDGRFESGERVATTRATLRAELRAPLALGEWATLEPWVAGFAAGYVYDAGLDPRADARGVAGVALSTRLSRRYGSVRHDIEPRLEWRAGLVRDAALPVPAADELDLRGPPLSCVLSATCPPQTPQKTLSAAPVGGFDQARLSLRNRLHLGPRTTFDLTLGQDLDIDRGRLAEAFAEGSLSVGILGATLNTTGEARFHPDQPPDPSVKAANPSRFDAFSWLRGSASLADRRGDDLHGTLTAMGPTGSESLAAGLDPFLDPRPAAVTPVAVGTAGLRARLGGATAGYDASFNARTQPVCTGTPEAPRVYQHAATVGWDSPCKCFQIAVRAVWNACDGTTTYGFQFSLSQFATARFGP
jgi:LPS-assembly protein